MTNTQPMTFADELRTLADFLDEHPAALPRYQAVQLDHWLTSTADMAELRRKIGGKWEKNATGNTYFILRRRITPHTWIDLNIEREEACEKVQVGTRTEMQPDPELVAEIPEVEVEVPVWEWKCSPILEEAQS